MAYQVTPEDMGSISDVEMAFSADRLLPPWEDIPREFREGNQYTLMAEAIMYDRPLPEGTIELKEGFNRFGFDEHEADPEPFKRRRRN